MNELDGPQARVVSAEPERIRVSVFGGRTQLDIALPLDLAVSSFTPELAKLVRSRDVAVDEDPRVKGERRTFWVLSLFDTDAVIAPHQTLRDAGVGSGELLRLSANRALSPPTLYDDVVDAAARLNKAAYAEWDSRSAQWMAYTGTILGALALAMLLLQPMTAVTRVTLSGLALVVVVGLTTFAAVANRSFGLHSVALALGAATIPINAALVVMPLVRFGAFGIAGACAALIVACYMCARIIRAGHWPFLATSLTAGLCGVAMLVHAVGARVDVVCVVLALLAILLCAGVPRFTSRLQHFETPVTAAAGDSPDEWSLNDPFPAPEPTKRADDTNSGTNMPTAEQVWDRVRSASLTRCALLVGFAGTTVAACAALLSDGDVVEWPAFAFVLMCAVVLGLRSRYFHTWGERSCVAVPAIALVIVACACSQAGVFPIPVTSVAVLLAIAVGAVLAGLSAQPGDGPTTRRTTTLAYLDYLTVGSLIPLALWVIGAYGEGASLW